MSIPRRTSPQRRVLHAIVHLLLIVIMIVPQVSFASAASNTVPDAATGLVQGRNEDLDAYLRRAAAANPQLFQQASIAAVQDAFNGELPEVAGEKSMEAQIAYYLRLAATGDEPNRAPTHTSSSSTIQGDAYVWNGTQADQGSATGSAWQLTARPGGDPNAFAQDFERMAPLGALPTGFLAATPETDQGMLSVPPEQEASLTDLAPAAASTSPSTGAIADRYVPDGITVPAPEAVDIAGYGDAEMLKHELSQRLAGAMTPAPVAAVSAVVTQSHRADLSVEITAPLTATFDDVITYTVTITNSGPERATNVRLTHELPANGVYKPGGTQCAAGDPETVTCAVGVLTPTQTISLTIPVQMKGNGVVTSTVTVKDAGGTLDPGGKSAEAEAETTVSSDSRSARQVGTIVIAANTFAIVAGEIEASDAVEIGYRTPKGAFAYHLRLGPDDSLTWKEGEQTVSGAGTLAQIVDNFTLFKGEFSIDTSKDEPMIIPAADVTPEVEKLSGFKIDGTPAITEVSVLLGTASLSTTIILGQAGVLTPTKLLVVGIIQPGGKAEATIPKFEAEVAGLKIKVSDALFKDDKITIKRALLTMPEKLGKLTGVISQMEFTATSISFGGVGVKVPIPNIYPVGKPITGTKAFTPTIAFVDNSATLVLDKNLYSVQVESTLQLTLPGNKQKVPVEIKIDAAGNLDGTIKEIKLTVAGQQLEMKDVKVTPSGLSVAEATLTIKRGETGKAPAKDAKKKTEPLLTVVVKHVTINKNGLSIGSAAVTLPDIKLGSTATFTKLTVTLTIQGSKADTSYEFALKGKLKINLTGNQQTVAFSGKMDKLGKLSGKIESLSLTIATSKLSLRNMAFSNNRFTATAATLTLPGLLGGTTVTVNQVTIDEKGLSFGDASVKIPVEFTIGKQAGEPDPTNSLQVKGSLTLVLAKDRTYGFAIEGTVTIKLAAQTVEASGSFRMDTTGKMRGSVDSFNLSIAGLTLAVKSASIEDSTLKADEATLAIPESWGGLSATVYKLEISEEEFSIGGGSFKLPEIKVGDMRLSLEGTLKKEPGGWLIAAGGSLKLPNTGGGCGGLGVSVEIFAGSAQSMGMRITPADAGTNAFQLRKASVSLQCTITLGTSGFVLTSISGTVSLNENVTRLDIKATIESQLRIGPYNAVTADGDMAIEYVKNPYKFEIGIGASMRIFSMFEAARARARMVFADGPVPFLFQAELNINAVIARGEVKLTAWTSDGNFHLVGRIFGSVGLRRGAITDRCFSIYNPFGDDWNVCLTLPSEDLFFDATMEFGEFRHGDGSTWGLKASIEIAGSTYGIYVNTEGNVKIGNVDEYRTIDTPSLQRAKQLNALVQARQLNPAALSSADYDLLQTYQFGDGSVTINVADVTRPGDLTLNAFLMGGDASFPVVLVRPDGLRIGESNAPDNVTFSQESVTPRDPVTGLPDTTAPPMLRKTITVTNAQVGRWQVFLSREPANSFVFNAMGTVYAAPVEQLKVVGANDVDNHVDLSWHQTSDITSTAVIYATQDPITTTARYTDTTTVTQTNGLTATEVITVDAGIVTQFGGVAVAEFALDKGDQTISRTIDLGDIKTGSYSLWLEVNDGRNTPTRKYFPGKVAVWHPWQDTWTGNVRLTPQAGALTVAWDSHPNPDVDGYEVEIQTSHGPYRVDAGDERSETITGLSAQEVYSVTVQAYNGRTALISISEAQTGRPLRAPFTLRAAPAALTINGGSSASVRLTVASTITPYPDQVFVDVANVPDGFDVALSTDVLTPTVAGATVGLIITPTADLPDGIYPVTVHASSSGDLREVTIPVTVKQPTFTPRVSRDALVLTAGGTVEVDIDASYQFGENDLIDVDVLDIPAGVEWGFTSQSFLPGAKATLVLTDTGYLAFGNYEVVLEATDYQQSHEIVLPLTVSGFALASPWDRRAVRAGTTTTFPVVVDGAAWTTPLVLGFEAETLTDHFITTVSNSSPRVPSTVTAAVTVLPNTPPGIYELAFQATSGTISDTLLLHVTVQDVARATDVVMDYRIQTDEDFLVAGTVYSYTLSPRNISGYPAEDVLAVDTMLDTTYLSLVDDGGCARVVQGIETSLSCELGTIAPQRRLDGPTLSWLIDPDAPDGEVVAHIGEAIAQDTTPYTETSTLDNLLGIEQSIMRVADLQLKADATLPRAGEVMTVTATLLNHGPSDADDTMVAFFLPTGVSLQSSSTGCTQDGQQIDCPVGDLAVDQDGAVFAAVRIDPNYRGALDIVVKASSASYEGNVEDNYAVVIGDTTANTRLSATLTPNRTRAVEGDTISYLLAVTNQGPATATGVKFSLSIPDIAKVLDLRIGDVAASLDNLNIAAGETLTATAEVIFLEDDQGRPEVLQLIATAHESLPVTATSPLLTVTNAKPTAVLSDTVTLDEGDVGILSVKTADPGSDYDTIDIAWDLDADGNFDDSDEPTVRFLTQGMDGPTTRAVAVRVRDDDGGEVIVRGTVVIRNVPPTVTVGYPQYQVYDLPFDIPFQVYDPQASDIQSARIDWGDGTVEQIDLRTGGRDEHAQHRYARISTYTVTICVADDDTGAGCSQVKLQAACRDNGLLVRSMRLGDLMTVQLENASGTVPIPSGMPLTLYNGDQIIHTFVLDQELAVGARRTLRYTFGGGATTRLRLVVDDDGTGKKTTDLCSGTLAASQQPFRLYMPFTIR